MVDVMLAACMLGTALVYRVPFFRLYLWLFVAAVLMILIFVACFIGGASSEFAGALAHTSYWYVQATLMAYYVQHLPKRTATA